MNKNAIFFAIDNGYCFALANALMSLKKNSSSILKNTDIIIFHTDISESNKNLLKKIHKNIIFENIEFSEEFSKMLDNPRVAQWGVFILAKFYGFKLVQKYEKVLHLDADILICRSLQVFFDIDADMAWRRVLPWNKEKLIKECFKTNVATVSVPSGGVLFFSDSLNKFNITENHILDAYEKVKNCSIYGIDELVFSYLAYSFDMQICELPMIYNDHVYHGENYNNKRESIILHFLEDFGSSTKPWKSLAAYMYLDEWRTNNAIWVEMGGTSPIDFTKEDYYDLLFEKECRKKFNKEIEGIKSGWSYRIGRIFTWLPRKMLGRK